MRTFINVEDIGPLEKAMAEAMEIKQDRYKYQHLGKNKTLMMIFFNNSLRTRLSTQKAAMNLGMNVIVLDVNAGAWKLETERGVIMDGDKSEHLLEAIPVMGCYCDMIGVRSFAGLTDREYDYAETVLLWRQQRYTPCRLLPTSLPLRSIKRWNDPKSCSHGLPTAVLCHRLCPIALPSG